MATVVDVFAAAVSHHQAGRFPDAERLYQQVLAADPNHVEAWHLRGVLALQTGQESAAIAHLEKALSLKPDFPQALTNLGLLYDRGGRLKEAANCYRLAIAIDPRYAASHSNLGNVLHRQQRPAEAVASHLRAIELEPSSAELHYNLALILQATGAVPQAAASYRQAIELRPDWASPYNNLGALLLEQGQLDAAKDCLATAIRLQPIFAEAHNNLGNVWNGLGRIEESLAATRRALAINPNSDSTHSRLLFGLHFCPSYDAAAIYDEHRRWNERHAAPLAKFIQSHTNEQLPERRLRIGYFSAEFRDHCQSFFTLPLLSHQDHEQFEIFCYSGTTKPDAVTEQLRPLADHWRDVTRLSAEQIAQMVRHDRIDILIDLFLHMDRGAPLTFARKPAPVQICWLGYPGTTGLAAIDYRFTDPFLDPPGMFDRFYSEESIRLPHSFWCYDPLTEGPEVNRLPAMEKGYVTFGCLNNFCKVNEGVLRLWAGVLRGGERGTGVVGTAHPTIARSRLVLMAPEGSARERTLAILGEEGIGAERVRFVAFQPRAEYLATYQQIDIGLETLPYNGHTTSLDSFWMGVPVPTIVGQTVVGRAGVCLLENLGLRELIAETPEQYVRIVSELAGDLERLAKLRGGLRERMERSPLMDGSRFARDMEAAYRMIWRRWCEGKGGE